MFLHKKSSVSELDTVHHAVLAIPIASIIYCVKILVLTGGAGFYIVRFSISATTMEIDHAYSRTTTSYNALLTTQDFHHFHENDELIPGKTVRELTPQIRQLVDMGLVAWTLVMPDSEPFNLIQIVNPVKHPQTGIAMQRYGLLDR